MFVPWRCVQNAGALKMQTADTSTVLITWRW